MTPQVAALLDLLSQAGVLLVGVVLVWLLMTERLVTRARLEEEKGWRKEWTSRLDMLIDLLRVGPRT